MSRHPISNVFSSLILLFFLVWSGLIPSECQASNRLAGDFSHVPCSFVENQGQTNPAVKYYTRGHGFALGFTPRGPVFLLNQGACQAKPDKAGLPAANGPGDTRAERVKRANQSPATRQATMLRLTLLGMSPEARMVPEEPQEGKVNYFSGNDPQSGAPIFPPTAPWPIGTPIRAST